MQDKLQDKLKSTSNIEGGINVLSLFDGMSCGMLAFLRLGIKPLNYYAYEIDKYAIKTTEHNFPNIKQCGDVFEADFTQYEGIDYLIGGSPCTFWSIVQSPDKRETTASGLGWELFSQYVRALNEAKPKYFLYENNKSMSKAIYKSISDKFGFEPILINSALVSAQNRNRYYWCGKRNDDGTYSKVDIPQPEDRGILLKDILEGNDFTSCDKGWTLTTSYGGAVAWNTIERHQRNMVAEPVNTTDESKSQTIKAQYQQTSIANICKYTSTYGASGVAESVRVGALPRPSGGIAGNTGLYAIPIFADSQAEPCEWDNNGNPTKAISFADGKTYIVHSVADGQIEIKGKTYPIKLNDGYYIIRKLTVRECMRLQTVPEWYDFSAISNSQAYKCLGNGWTIDIIVHILKGLINDG